jgi:hypothetical protein
VEAYDIALVLLRVVSNDIVDVEPVITRLLARWTEIRRRALLIIE